MVPVLQSSLFCPSCGTMLPFTTDITHSCVCSCGKVIHRSSSGNLEISSFTSLSESDSLLQPGTTGSWKGQAFTVKGRFRIWLEEAVLNYWTVTFDSGGWALLEEGYGLFTMMQETAVPESMTGKRIGELKLSSEFKTEEGALFYLQEKNAGVNIEVEKEAFLPITKGRVLLSDFASESSGTMSIIEWQEKVKTAYTTQSSSFHDFNFKNLRAVSFIEKSIYCDSCSSKIIIKTYPYANCCSCSNCKTIYILDPLRGYVSGKTMTASFDPHLPIGAKGTIDSVEFEVLGWTLKEENNHYASRWREYCLFNAKDGFAFLSEYDGNWIFLKEKKNAPVLNKDGVKSIEYNGENFERFNQYTHKVIAANGSFPYNIFDNQNTLATEYISPPEIWIREKHSSEGIRWYYGTHISKKTLERAFNNEVSLPYKEGVGAVEPKGYISIPNLAKGTLLALLLLLIVHSLFVLNKKNQLIWENQYFFKDTSNQLSFTTQKFHLDKFRSNLEIELFAPVDNSWMEIGATLVNTDNGKEYTLEKGVEYYHGYTDGETWSEGSKTEQAYFTGLPSGNYLLEAIVSRESTSGSVNDFTVKVTYDVANDRNLYISILILLVVALIKYYLTQSWEKERWSNSPYNPNPLNEDD